MTDKKEIIIDGVDVSECEYVCNTAFGNIGCKLPFNEEIHCCNIPNCYFKQLKRKEQECEKYEKALDEILAITKGLVTDCDPISVNYRYIDINNNVQKIVNIINKAKGGE